MAESDPNVQKEYQRKIEPVCAAVLTRLASGIMPPNLPPADYPDAALSILVDSSSRGPNLLALSSLGWAYGNGAGGGMGDWGECHYMPGEIGNALDALEQSISLEIAGADPTKRHFQTRYCTVGGLPPFTKAYDGYLWSPAVAGICVPAACDSDSLYTLFAQPDFVNDLSRLALADTNNDEDNDFEGKRRRRDYITSLTNSLAAGRKFQEGIICEGDTGLPELDDQYLGNGYYLTLAILAITIICVVVSTITNALQTQYENEDESSMKEDEERTQIIANSSESSQSSEESDLIARHYDSQGTARILPTNQHENNDCLSNNTNSPFDSQGESKMLQVVKKTNDYLAQKLVYFDATANLNDIASNSKNNILFVHGLRSISMLWIILGHTIVVQSSIGYQNPAAVLPPHGMSSGRPAMLFFAARYSVDTFFFLSGFLVMRGLLNRFSKSRPKNWAVPFLVHRALRILPTYGFVLLLWWKVAVTMGKGPFWPRWASFVAQCDRNAWTNMLFLNNVIPFVQPLGETSECMYHTWYLGVDFQLGAILAPIFFPLYMSSKRKTKMFELGAIIVIIVASFICSHIFDWSGHLFDGKQTVSFDRGFYIQTFFRATPYIAGFITAQLWHEICERKKHFKIPYHRILTMICIGTLLILTFGGVSAYDRRPCLVWEDTHVSECGSGWSKNDLAFYNSLVRPAWSLALAVLSLLALNGQLFCVSSVLNWNGWTFISKLSFTMYLLHPLTINTWFLRRTSKFYFSHIDLIFSYAAVVVVTYFTALAVALLVEWPMSKLTKHLEKKMWDSSRDNSKIDVAEPDTSRTCGFQINQPNTENEEGIYLIRDTDKKENYSSY